MNTLVSESKFHPGYLILHNKSFHSYPQKPILSSQDSSHRRQGGDTVLSMAPSVKGCQDSLSLAVCIFLSLLPTPSNSEGKQEEKNYNIYDFQEEILHGMVLTGKETPSLNGRSDFDDKVGRNSQGGKGKGIPGLVTCQKKGPYLRNSVQFSIHCLALTACQQYGQPWKDGVEQDNVSALREFRRPSRAGAKLDRQVEAWDRPQIPRQVSYLAALLIHGSIVEAVG